MSQIERSPVTEFSQTISEFPSALKSAEPTILHPVGTVGRITALLNAALLTSQTDRSPVDVFCQRMRPVDGNGTAAADAVDIDASPEKADDCPTSAGDGLLVLKRPGSAP